MSLWTPKGSKAVQEHSLQEGDMSEQVHVNGYAAYYI